MNMHKENLDDLLRQFHDERTAREIKQDLAEGQALFDENPAPAASPELLDSVKSRIQMKLRTRRYHRSLRYIRNAAAAAAVILVLALIPLFRSPESQTGGKTHVAVSESVLNWDDDGEYGLDSNMQLIEAQLDDISDTLLSLQLGESLSEEPAEITDLEMDLVDTSELFWKG